MFNFIVSGRVGNDRRGSISASRVFGFTPPEVEKRFRKEDETIDFAALMPYPTLLLQEGTGAEPVRFARLTNVIRVGKDYQLDYAIDHSQPKLTNADINALSCELDLHEWELGTNHWAVKDVDFFEVLCRQKLSRGPSPSVFKLSENPVNSKLICMMMPFSGTFNGVYAAIKSAVESDGFEMKRADDFWLHPYIMHDVIELICTAHVVICDLSGKNPNVFYEAGIAHTLGKEVILITQNIEEVPFDLRPLRCLTYLNNDQGWEKLVTEIRSRLKTISSRS